MAGRALLTRRHTSFHGAGGPVSRRRILAASFVGTAIEFFDSGHEINGEGTFRFLHEHLDWPE